MLENYLQPHPKPNEWCHLCKWVLILLAQINHNVMVNNSIHEIASQSKLSSVIPLMLILHSQPVFWFVLQSFFVLPCCMGFKYIAWFFNLIYRFKPVI